MFVWQGRDHLAYCLIRHETEQEYMQTITTIPRSPCTLRRSLLYDGAVMLSSDQHGFRTSTQVSCWDFSMLTAISLLFHEPPQPESRELQVQSAFLLYATITRIAEGKRTHLQMMILPPRFVLPTAEIVINKRLIPQRGPQKAQISITCPPSLNRSPTGPPSEPSLRREVELRHRAACMGMMI